MRKIKIAVQYDGTEYAGWQVQKNDITIQGLIEKALHSVTGERSRVTGAARTDAGVHALEHIATFGTKTGLEPEIFIPALNRNLPGDIRIIDAVECDEDFHPRFSAKNKIYSYIIAKPVAFSVFFKRYSWQLPYRLDLNAMHEASRLLTGRHDFSSFQASGCSAKNPVREVNYIKISKLDSVDFMTFSFHTPVIKLTIEANAFLRHMVRNITGTLVEIGRGKRDPNKIVEILDARDRNAAGQTAPARGLFLEKIEY